MKLIFKGLVPDFLQNTSSFFLWYDVCLTEEEIHLKQKLKIKLL